MVFQKLVCWMSLCILLLVASLPGRAQVLSAANKGAFVTLIQASDLDDAAFAQWFDGSEKGDVRGLGNEALPEGARHVLWTRDSRISWDGVRFGISKISGARYLRIGFKTPLSVGTILVRGSVQVSVLKANATYPGALNDDAQWIPAWRVKDDQSTRDEPNSEEYSAWILPPHTITRALRFTHTSSPTDNDYAGYLGGVYILGERWANIAPQAKATTSANNDRASLINNGSNDKTWGAWDNGSEGGAQAVSPEHLETMMLTWPKPVTLRGLCTLWTGFGAAQVEIYNGSTSSDPRTAPDSDWQKIGDFSGLQNFYPLQLGPNWMDFGRDVSTRAVRLRITSTTQETHPHLNGKTKDGKRIWLGELMAWQPLGDTALITPAPISSTRKAPHPPIAIRFRLPIASYVTLVIEKPNGVRVRNLVAETRFPAGDNVVWWDGMDDLGRDADAAHHGVYRVPGAFVAPGNYRVRGLYHAAIDLRYQFSVYNAGSPAWDTADGTGGWLTNHTPPSSALFLPAKSSPTGKDMFYLGSYVSEGGSGLAWVNLNGRKLGGRGWVGGNWTAAPFLARDSGDKAIPDTNAYVGSAWEGELRLTALTKSGDKAVLTPTFKFDGGSDAERKQNSVLGGIAVRNGVLVASLTRQNQLLWIDVAQGKRLGTTTLDDPRGVAFDAQGRLLALSSTRLLRFDVPNNPVQTSSPPTSSPQTSSPQTLATDLQDPQGLALDDAGNIYVSERGASHQVKVFDASGKLRRAIGHAGAPVAGKYDAEHMNNPRGLTIDSLGHLWVAEEDYQPKRVSVWDAPSGKLLHAFYGPSSYGGGGTLDPRDRTRFYYTGMEFKIDWKSGENHPVNIFSRPGANDLPMPDGFGVNNKPETPLYADNRQYMTNCYNSNPTNGASIALLWMMKNDVAVPVAAMGMANDWSVFKDIRQNPQKTAFAALLPPGVDPARGVWDGHALFFIWQDKNGDGQIQPDEVTFRKLDKGPCDGVTVMPDLSFLATNLNGQTERFRPQGFLPGGVPEYSNAGEVLATGAQHPTTSGGGQTLLSNDDWTILTVAPQPFSALGMGGVKSGVPLWTYPSLWPGLHASHEAPTADEPGEVLGTTRLLGGFVTPQKSDAGPLWAINGNFGDMYVFTQDGLFVTQLFRDVRSGKLWTMPVAQRDMLVNDVSLHDENFWPTWTQTADGQIYLNSSLPNIVRVDGLETIRRLPVKTLRVTTVDLQNAQAYFVQSEAARQSSEGDKVLKIAISAAPPIVDGNLDDWQGADWATIDKRGVAAWFDSNSKPYNVVAALRVSGDRLYAAFKTGDANLLNNSGEVPNALFKTGGALDLMLDAIPGGERLIVTQVGGKTRALLYRAHVPNTTTETVPFSSPLRTIRFDRVDDISADVNLATNGKGNFEYSIPLSTLGLTVHEGAQMKGDLGLLRGDGRQTTQRVYWSNKATGITSDVPSEAELTPQLWGRWIFQAQP